MSTKIEIAGLDFKGEGRLLITGAEVAAIDTKMGRYCSLVNQ